MIQVTKISCLCRILVVSIVLLTFLIKADIIKAAITFEISNPINVSDELSVDVSISGLAGSSCDTNKCYLQGAFQKSSGESYFGFTQNNSGSWYEYISSPQIDYIKSTFFNFEVQEGSWSGKLKVKNNIESTAYRGPGAYVFKLKRYSGKSASDAGESNEIAVNLFSNVPTQVPTSTPNSTDTPVPTTTSTPTPTLNITSAPKPVITPSATPKKSDKPLSTEVPQEELVLGLRNELQSSSPVPTNNPEAKKTFPILPLFFIFGGLICIILAGWGLFAKLRSEGYSQ